MGRIYNIITRTAARQRQREELTRQILSLIHEREWIRFDRDAYRKLHSNRKAVFSILCNLALEEQLHLFEDKSGNLVALSEKEFAWCINARARRVAKSAERRTTDRAQTVSPLSDEEIHLQNLGIVQETTNPEVSAVRSAQLRQSLPMRPREARHQKVPAEAVEVKE